ncbi:single-stranded DNA-binding protein [Streptomyces iconiensis]|uniref:Single-stranded DNA-binding protein n=1 Tax=Streptomyces iconiensis TaxID=1384038 RepID=A0ABT7A4G3_9ACTN|nr:single-stranded DNA-binding protein [Streptomyces iconiensis]MDJ1136238.1 single-stranded DNA-binding protein [Streptomyces iconiensis]
MSGETTITMTGNVVAEPELRFTPSGAAVCNFRIASTPRKFDKQRNEWTDGDPLFLGVTVWRQQAEHVAESVQKGMRVIIVGKLTQRQYDDKDGNRRSSYDIQADEVAPSLLRATAVVTKATGQQGNAQGAPQANGWNQRPAADQWQTQPGYSDEPPF